MKGKYLFVGAVVGFLICVVAFVGSFLFFQLKVTQGGSSGIVHNLDKKGNFPAPVFAQAEEGKLTLADVAQEVMPSVVNISSTKVVQSNGSRNLNPFFNDPFFRDFFNNPWRNLPKERKEKSLGSGVIVSQEGIVVTNNHVVEQAEEILVGLADGRQFKAELVGTDPKSDLAVIRLQGEKGDFKDLKAMVLGNSDRARIGDVVLALGNPFGVGQTVTMGIISAKNRANVDIVDYEDFIQTDAAINPGNSGGALVSMEGELIGINTAILSRSGGYQGVGFAIPSNMVKNVVDNILKHGKVVRGWLGVSVQEITPELAEMMNFPNTQGVLVSSVVEESPAERAGLKRDDVILNLNGQAVNTPDQLRNMIASMGAGVSVRFEVRRAGEIYHFQVELSEIPGSASGQQVQVDQGVLSGMSLVELNELNRDKYEISENIEYGVIVAEVQVGGAAESAGLEPGNVILEVNKTKIQSLEGFNKAYKENERRTLLLVSRDGGTVYMILSR